MIFQGLFNILDLYFNDIDLFYNSIDHYFRDKIIDSFGTDSIEKEDMEQKLDEITLFLIKLFVELGFELNEVETEFLDPFLQIQEDDIQVINSPVQLYEKKIAPILYEIFLEKIVDYLVDTEVAPLMLKFKDEGFLPIEFIMELRNLKNLLEYTGIDPRRVRMTWVSAAEGHKFAEVVKEVTEDIKKLGPMQHFRRENKW